MYVYYVFMSVCLCVHSCVSLFIYSFIYIPIYSYVYLFTYLPTCAGQSISIYLSFCLITLRACQQFRSKMQCRGKRDKRSKKVHSAPFCSPYEKRLNNLSYINTISLSPYKKNYSYKRQLNLLRRNICAIFPDFFHNRKMPQINLFSQLLVFFSIFLPAVSSTAGACQFLHFPLTLTVTQNVKY